MSNLNDQVSEEAIVFIEEIDCKALNWTIIIISKFIKVFLLLGAK